MKPSRSGKFDYQIGWVCRPDARVKKPNGEPVIDAGSNEGILDIQKKWIEGCKTLWYQAIEADNIDSHMRPDYVYEPCPSRP